MKTLRKRGVKTKRRRRTTVGGARGGTSQGSNKDKCGINPKSNRCKKGLPDPQKMCEMKPNGKCSKKKRAVVSGPKKTESTDTEIKELMVFTNWPMVGDSVEYLDNKSNKWKNAQIHQITPASPDDPLRPSCVIKFSDGNFRDTNFNRLRRTAPQKSRGGPLHESGSCIGTLSIGDLAVVHSLKRSSQHNGKIVRLIKSDSSGRWVVGVEGEQDKMSIKAQNLCRLSFQNLDKDTSPPKKSAPTRSPPTHFFNVGSSKDYIIKILGPPKSSQAEEVYSHSTASGHSIYSQKVTLFYNGNDVITLIDGKVHAYRNLSGKLPIGPPIERKRGTISIGTNKNEVL